MIVDLTTNGIEISNLIGALSDDDTTLPLPLTTTTPTTMWPTTPPAGAGGAPICT